MKVMAFNCSPARDKGNTAQILRPFLEGIKDAGADLELYHVTNLKIRPCQGGFDCWLKTPGECFQNDDMKKLYPKLVKADILVFATPVYADGMSGLMKNLLDRMIPIIQPFIELRDGHCRHLPREGHSEDAKLVLISSCGFWEMDNFDPLVAHIKAACRNMSREFAGALLRPHGSAVKVLLNMGVSLDDVFDAAREAGRQLIRTGKMSSENLEIVGRELMPLDDYLTAANLGFQRELEQAGQL